MLLWASLVLIMVMVVAQGLVPLLLQRIAEIFPVSTIYTPFDQVGTALGIRLSHCILRMQAVQSM